MNEDGMPATQASWPQLWLELAGGLAVTIALGALAASVMALPLRVAGVAAVVMAAVGALILHVWPDTRRGLGPANRVTLLRAALVALVAGALAAPAWAQQHATALALVAALALLMDGVDGWVARR
ncbi:MAG: CDP-alcohol phosphatidyltransferase family protein, partial [Thauera sp.]|nr:CDP-alcohol phosphatidyltransferase family protein [Thauera sp.]